MWHPTTISQPVFERLLASHLSHFTSFSLSTRNDDNDNGNNNDWLQWLQCLLMKRRQSTHDRQSRAIPKPALCIMHRMALHTPGDEDFSFVQCGVVRCSSLPARLLLLLLLLPLPPPPPTKQRSLTDCVGVSVGVLMCARACRFFSVHFFIRLHSI